MAISVKWSRRTHKMGDIVLVRRKSTKVFKVKKIKKK